MNCHSATVRAAAIDDYRNGCLVKDIAARHKVSPESVRLWARQAGIARSGGEYVGRCNACGSSRGRDGGLCRPCSAEVPLTGGRWIPRGGIVVWQPEEAA